jgi:hypothetical protein
VPLHKGTHVVPTTACDNVIRRHAACTTVITQSSKVLSAVSDMRLHYCSSAVLYSAAAHLCTWGDSGAECHMPGSGTMAKPPGHCARRAAFTGASCWVEAEGALRARLAGVRHGCHLAHNAAAHLQAHISWLQTVKRLLTISSSSSSSSCYPIKP